MFKGALPSLPSLHLPVVQRGPLGLSPLPPSLPPFLALHVISHQLPSLRPGRGRPPGCPEPTKPVMQAHRLHSRQSDLAGPSSTATLPLAPTSLLAWEQSLISYLHHKSVHVPHKPDFMSHAYASVSVVVEKEISFFKRPNYDEIIRPAHLHFSAGGRSERKEENFVLGFSAHLD